MTDISIGFDTSNYTTSVCAFSENGPVADIRRLLPVPEGSVGLRQSDALFLHTKALPELCGMLKNELSEKLGEWRTASVGVSFRPVSREGSYMPCFLAGVSCAGALAAGSGAPLFRFSHQDGHIAAVLFGERGLCDERAADLTDKDTGFYALHLSGGTCELVKASADYPKDGFFRAEKIYGSLDVTCGQLIDRCGVALGMGFPCGKELEGLAERSEKRYKTPLSAKPGGLNLSGIQNKAEKMISGGESREDTARFVFDAVTDAIIYMTGRCPEGSTVLFSGGVTSSHLIRSAVTDRYGSTRKLVFAHPRLSSDNAVGIAALAMISRRKQI